MGLFSGSQRILNEISPDEVVQLFKEEGFSAELLKTPSGKPYIRFKVDGFNSQVIFFTECKEKPGYFPNIQLSASFRDKISAEKANKWNLEYRFIKAYSDSDGELSFERDISLEGGVTKEYLLEQIAQWRNYFSRVLAFFGS